MIPAHDSPLAALAFNASATRLASASERVSTLPVDHETDGLHSLAQEVRLEVTEGEFSSSPRVSPPGRHMTLMSPSPPSL